MVVVCRVRDEKNNEIKNSRTFLVSDDEMIYKWPWWARQPLGDDEINALLVNA